MKSQQQHIAYVSLGSNLHNPIQQIKRAFQELNDIPQTRLLDSSSLYQTKPVGYANQPDFINAVAKLATALTPEELLVHLQGIERTHKRTQTDHRNAPRTLDLDILLYEDRVLNTEHLIVPHPQLTKRLFVLQPLTDIAPALILPDGQTLQAALENCHDQVSNPKKLCITGP